VCGGILGGLVSITAGCGNIHPRCAPIVGFIGGAIYCGASELLQKLKIDDPVEAFPVHGACGIWGVLAVPIFDINSAIAMAPAGVEVGSSILVQALGVVVIFLWTGLWSTILFVAIKAAGFLRVDEEHEKMGIDNAEFSPKAAYKSAGNI
jgi:Amt family ammonium transporter